MHQDSRGTFINQQLLLVDKAIAGEGDSKHKKMTASPFVFFRGTAQLFYADFANKGISLSEVFSDIPLTNIMGDCHTSNFGFFTEEGSHCEKVVFSINDFDDACIGHSYWDLLRYLVSLHLALDHGQGVKSKRYPSEKDYSLKALVDKQQLNKALEMFLQSYAMVLQTRVHEHHNAANHAAQHTNQRDFAYKQENADVLDKNFNVFSSPSVLQKRYKKALSCALGGNDFLHKSALAKAVDLTSFPLRFKDKPDKYSRLNIDIASIKEKFSAYFYESIIDIVKRLNSGTGSVNMERYYLLIGPKNASTTQNLPLCHVVEIKQQRKAAALFYFPNLHHQNMLNPAHLTVKCQRQMQRKQDYVLDSAYFNAQHYLIRSRHHAKVGIDPEDITLGKTNAEQNGFANYASACGEALAKAHCRANKASIEFEKASLRALKEAKSSLLNVANTYSQQVIKDWQWFCEQNL